jgi:uncharacterized protein YbbC (DUF1343 family)
MVRLNVRNGIDNIDKYSHVFEGKRVGLVTNPTGTDKSLVSTIDILNRKCLLKALYSPEHGIRGHLQAGERVETYVDEMTGLPVYSLYGASKKPGAEMLDGIDILVFDIQDIGARYYTFISTMALCMESCAEQGKAFVVLDRLNPVGGAVEGNIPETRFRSFVGMCPVPVRHGLTIGELALLIKAENRLNVELEVVRAEGWKRDAYFDETDLHWINPTPNMPSPDAALLYIGTCLFEGTCLSEGRGTTRPFEIVGAPWLNPWALAERINRKGLEGIVFRPLYFSPVFSKYAGQVCGGVQLHVIDRRKIKPFACGVKLLMEIRRMGAEKFTWLPPAGEENRPFIDLLAGTDELRLSQPDNEDRLLEKWSKQSDAFTEDRKKYLLYE